MKTLKLKKEVVATLSEGNLGNVYGGVDRNTFHSQCICTVGCPTNGCPPEGPVVSNGCYSHPCPTEPRYSDYNCPASWDKALNCIAGFISGEDNCILEAL